MPDLAYLLGASHSGSTLLAMLLGAQPGACTAGELKASALGDADTYRCSCHQPIQECGFWKSVGRAMELRGIPDFDITRSGTDIHGIPSNYVDHLLAPLHRGVIMEHARDLLLSLSPRWRTSLREIQSRNLALIESLLELTGARIVVDSSKSALRLKYLLPIRELVIRVIHVVRDGRAVSLTYTDEWTFADAANPSLRGGGGGTHRAPPRRSMAEAAREWMRSNQAAEAVLSKLPQDRWTRIRYEDLCRDPVASLQRINGFLGLDPEHPRIDHRSVSQHVIGNGMRLDTTATIRLDNRWESTLAAHDLREFERIAGKANRHYGYR